MDDRKRFELIAENCQDIQRPILAPCLEYRLLDDGQVLLVSESFNALLHGQLYSDLLPLLDGTRTQTEIMNTLERVHFGFHVASALAALADKGFIISGDYEMDISRAAFWCALGVNPSRIENKLNNTKVAVHGEQDGSLTSSLQSLGVNVDDSGFDLSIHLCSDMLATRFESINREHIESERPWLIIRPHGIHPLISPIFQKRKSSACWACFAHRNGGNQEVHRFLRNKLGEEEAYRPSAAEPLALNVVYAIAAIEIVKWLALGEVAPLHQHAISLSLAEISSSCHPVARRPQCRVCGDEALRRPDRQPLPLRLSSSPVQIRTSGGLRTVSPAATLQKYAHLVSPVSGVANVLRRATAPSDSWSHVYTAGSNLALRAKDLSTLRRSLRSQSAGKGSTAEQSKASALCEAVERYSGACHGDEIQNRRCFDDFSRQGEAAAIHPNAVQLFSETQFDQADEISSRGDDFGEVPPRFRTDRNLHWTPVWSLSQHRHRYLPTALLYFMTPEQRGREAGLRADSNGCAAGNTLEEAILQGFFELVERDALALWWYNRLRKPAVDMDSFGDEYLSSAAEYYHRRQREMWVLDLTADFAIPVFVAVSHRADQVAENIIIGAGAHIDPAIAALRAVCEMNQALVLMPRPGTEQTSCRIDDLSCLQWWKQAKIKDHRYLAPARQCQPADYSHYAVPAAEDLRDEVEWCRKQVESKGMEFLALDQTRPDVGMPVVRVIVPGLRHFRERFAPGRLYEVPVQMGWRSRATDEADLNKAQIVF